MATDSLIVKISNVGTNITEFYIYGYNTASPTNSGSISPNVVSRYQALQGFTASFDHALGYNAIKLLAKTPCFPSSSNLIITTTTPVPIDCSTNGSTLDVQNIGSNKLILNLNGTPGADVTGFNVYTYTTISNPHFISGTFTTATMQGGVTVNYIGNPTDQYVLISGSSLCSQVKISSSIPAPPAECDFPNIIAYRRGDNGVNVRFDGVPGTDLGPFKIYAYPDGVTVTDTYLIATNVSRAQIVGTSGWVSSTAVNASYNRVMVTNIGTACVGGYKTTTLALGASLMEININNLDTVGTSIGNANRRITKVEFINKDSGGTTTITDFYDQATGYIYLPAPISSSRYYYWAGQQNTNKWKVKGYLLPGDYKIKVYVSASYAGYTEGGGKMDTTLACWIGDATTQPTWNGYYVSDSFAKTTSQSWCYTFVGFSSNAGSYGGYRPESTGSTGDYWIKVRPEFFNPASPNFEPFVLNFSTEFSAPAAPVQTCIDPYTNILITKEGDTILAKDLSVGDIIYTYNYKKGFKSYGYYEVKYHNINYDNEKILITFDDDTDIITSNTHNFMLSDGSWRQVFEFNGDENIKGIYRDKKVVNMKNIGGGDVVVITVDSASTYISNGLISHNVATDPATGTDGKLATAN
jgi:hypothetical protein